MFSLPVFQTEDSFSKLWNDSISFVFAILGLFCVIAAFWPGFYNTWKTKDTEFLPIGLFSLFLLVGVLMSAGSIAGICESPKPGPMYMRGCVFTLLNVFVMLTNLYTVGLWCKNKFLGRRRADSSYADVSETSEYVDDEQEEVEYNEEESQEESNLMDLGLAI